MSINIRRMTDPSNAELERMKTVLFTALCTYVPNIGNPAMTAETLTSWIEMALGGEEFEMEAWVAEVEVDGQVDSVGIVGVALWNPPTVPDSSGEEPMDVDEAWDMDLGRQVQLPPHRKYPSSEAGAGHSPVTTSLALDRDDKFRAIQEWWYLALLGVEPAWQGRGVGSALLTHHAQMVAPEGVPLALNTQCEQCVGFYQRRGFAIRHEELWALPNGGVHHNRFMSFPADAPVQ